MTCEMNLSINKYDVRRYFLLDTIKSTHIVLPKSYTKLHNFIV